MKNLYLVIGAQKSGTTSIYQLLRNHPGINMAIQKETKFFYHDHLYEKGISFFQSEFFQSESLLLPNMDIDPSYLYFDFIPERIYNIMGAHVKFIVILRDPAIRAYSHYLMEISRQNETQTFEKAISMEESRIKSMSGNLLFSYINRGLYARQIERYLQYFPLEKFKFFIFEDDFLLNKNAMLESICSFMDIKYNHDYFPKNIKANYTRKPIIRSIDQILKGGFVKIPFLKKNTLYKSVTRAISNKLIWLNTSKNVQKLSEELRRKLIKIYFLEDIQKLEKLINRDLSSWTSGVESS